MKFIVRTRNYFLSDEVRPFTIFLGIFIGSGIINPAIWSPESITSMLYIITPMMMMTAGFMVPLIVGGIDISLASMIALSNVLVTGFMVRNELPIPLAILLVLMICTGAGVINGLIIVKGRIPSFIATIATGIAIRGIVLVHTGGTNIPNLPSAFIDFFTPTVFGIPRMFLIGFCIILILSFLLKTTRFGRHLYAIGGNEEAARTAGINVDLLKVVSFAIAGLMYGLGGILMTARIASGWPGAALGWELDGLAAAVLGGGDFAGGIGMPIGALPGVLVLQVILRILVMMGVDPYFQYVAKGSLVIIAAVLLTGRFAIRR
jgi:ribose/xylose/arabinose/galactoside ABC-type transport system permease subunit